MVQNFLRSFPPSLTNKLKSGTIKYHKRKGVKTMKELNEMTLVEIKSLEDAIKARKAELKATVKSEKADADQMRIDACNEAIENGTLTSGAKVVILYGSKNVELVAEIVGVNSVGRDSITCECDNFTGNANDKGKKRRYINKSRFVKMA